MDDKATLRLIAKNLCKDVDCKLQSSIELLNVLKPMLDNSYNISIYNAFGYEISLVHIINYLIANNKNVYHPIAYRSSKIMRFELYNAKAANSIFNSDDHEVKDEIKWQDLDLIIMPLLAVDKFGTRLGKGGGYYDATLDGIRQLDRHPTLIGVGFNCQFLDIKLPQDKWDITLDYFASEVNLVKF